MNTTKNEQKVRLYLPLFIILAIYTGARKGAILDLRWSQIDLKLGRIDLNPPGRQQTSKKRPIIPIPRKLSQALKLAKMRSSDIGYVINRHGRPLGDIKKGFNAAAKRAGLEDVVIHTLRHTCGTWMAQKGVPLFQIAGWLGHSLERTTELYLKHHPDYLMDAMQAME